MKPFFSCILGSLGLSVVVTCAQAQSVDSTRHLRKPARMSLRLSTNPAFLAIHLSDGQRPTLDAYTTKVYDPNGNEVDPEEAHTQLRSLLVTRTPANQKRLTLPAENAPSRYQLTPLYQDPDTKDPNRQYFPK